MTAAPVPSHILRTHAEPVFSVSFSPDNERLYSGDGKGNIVVTSTRSLRPLAQWSAHKEGILGVEEWEGCIVTHGRDNKLHVWESVLQDPATRLRDAATTPGLKQPTLLYSMDVNALNYCRFSLWSQRTKPENEEPSALIALPNLVDSSVADIWELPSKNRLHAAVGKAGLPQGADGRGQKDASGIIMSMHLFEAQHPNASDQIQLRLLCGYENGSVKMWGYTEKDKSVSIEGVGWDLLWTAKMHVESVMAMAVTKSHQLALTVSADHLIGRYDLTGMDQTCDVEKACTKHRMKHPGNAAIAIRDDGRVCAVGGWDGKIRLFSTKTMKPLGTLDCHRKNCQSVSFARSTLISQSSDADENSDDEMTTEEKEDRCRWLAAGSQDCRVSIWSLISFERK